MTETQLDLDNKMIHKGALFKLVNNGGTLKLNNMFGISINHNHANPSSPFVEIRVFAVPINSKFEGNINPTLTKTKLIKAKPPEGPKLDLEEGAGIDL